MSRPMMILINLTVAVCLIAAAAGDEKLPDAPSIEDLSKLPANTWTLIGVDASGGAKSFARVAAAPDFGRLYL